MTLITVDTHLTSIPEVSNDDQFCGFKIELASNVSFPCYMHKENMAVYLTQNQLSLGDSVCIQGEMLSVPRQHPDGTGGSSEYNFIYLQVKSIYNKTMSHPVNSRKKRRLLMEDKCDHVVAAACGSNSSSPSATTTVSSESSNNNSTHNTRRSSMMSVTASGGASPSLNNTANRTITIEAKTFHVSAANYFVCTDRFDWYFIYMCGLYFVVKTNVDARLQPHQKDKYYVEKFETVRNSLQQLLGISIEILNHCSLNDSLVNSFINLAESIIDIFIAMKGRLSFDPLFEGIMPLDTKTPLPLPIYNYYYYYLERQQSQ